MVVNIKSSATCFGLLNHHLAKYKIQYWYFQRVRTLWDPILFTNYIDTKFVILL